MPIRAASASMTRECVLVAMMSGGVDGLVQRCGSLGRPSRSRRRRWRRVSGGGDVQQAALKSAHCGNSVDGYADVPSAANCGAAAAC